MAKSKKHGRNRNLKKSKRKYINKSAKRVGLSRLRKKSRHTRQRKLRTKQRRYRRSIKRGGAENATSTSDQNKFEFLKENLYIKSKSWFSKKKEIKYIIDSPDYHCRRFIYDSTKTDEIYDYVFDFVKLQKELKTQIEKFFDKLIFININTNKEKQFDILELFDWEKINKLNKLDSDDSKLKYLLNNLKEAMKNTLLRKYTGMSKQTYSFQNVWNGPDFIGDLSSIHLSLQNGPDLRNPDPEYFGWLTTTGELYDNVYKMKIKNNNNNIVNSYYITDYLLIEHIMIRLNKNNILNLNLNGLPPIIKYIREKMLEIYLSLCYKNTTTKYLLFDDHFKKIKNKHNEKFLQLVNNNLTIPDLEAPEGYERPVGITVNDLNNDLNNDFNNYDAIIFDFDFTISCYSGITDVFNERLFEKFYHTFKNDDNLNIYNLVKEIKENSNLLKKEYANKLNNSIDETNLSRLLLTEPKLTEPNLNPLQISERIEVLYNKFKTCYENNNYIFILSASSLKLLKVGIIEKALQIDENKTIIFPEEHCIVRHDKNEIGKNNNTKVHNKPYYIFGINNHNSDEDNDISSNFFKQRLPYINYNYISHIDINKNSDLKQLRIDFLLYCARTFKYKYDNELYNSLPFETSIPFETSTDPIPDKKHPILKAYSVYIQYMMEQNFFELYIQQIKENNFISFEKFLENTSKNVIPTVNINIEKKTYELFPPTPNLILNNPKIY